MSGGYHAVFAQHIQLTSSWISQPIKARTKQLQSLENKPGRLEKHEVLNSALPLVPVHGDYSPQREAKRGLVH